MTTYTFDPDNTLAGGLYALTPREAIRLAIGLCQSAERCVGSSGGHGAIWPGNISMADGQVALGAPCVNSVSQLPADALEFVAPEQFWNGSITPASDVYSIGLVLYTALNGGVLPFFDPEQEHTPQARATALQNRMRGVTPPAPRSAGRELAALVEKAVSFQAEDRYPDPRALMQALEALPEGAAVPAVVAPLPLTDAELHNVHSYKVDKNFEKITPPREKKQREGAHNATEERLPRRKARWVLPTVLVVLIAVAIVLLLRGCRDYYDPSFPISSAEPTVPVDSSSIHPPVPDTTPNPAATPEPTPTPEETPTAAKEPRYEAFLENVTWEQAKARCEEKGGHLAVVKDADTLAEVIALAEDLGATYVWLGAYRDGAGTWRYVTGETMDYAVWDTGEPSAMDMDGTREDYLLLWYRKNIGTWSYNDMRNDPLSVVSSYRGRLAYVCQFDD